MWRKITSISEFESIYRIEKYRKLTELGKKTYYSTFVLFYSVTCFKLRRLRKFFCNIPFNFSFSHILVIILSLKTHLRKLFYVLCMH